MATSTSVGIAVFYTVAGVLFTIGAIDTGLPGDVVQNMFLTGSCIYFSAGGLVCICNGRQGAAGALCNQQSRRCRDTPFPKHQLSPAAAVAIGE